MNKNLVYITLDQDGSTIVLNAPDSFESTQRFADFVQGIDGVAFYDRETRRRTAPLGRLAALTTRLRDKRFDVELSSEARTALQRFSAAQMFELQRVRERITQVDVQIKTMQEEKGENPVGLYNFQRFGAEWLALTTGGLLADQMGTGKSQGVSEPVLTPDGWRTMGDLRVGDFIIGSDGLPTEVLGVFPQGRRDVYKILLEDDRWTRCDFDHLWLVRKQGLSRTCVRSLRDLFHESLNEGACWSIPVLHGFDTPSVAMQFTRLHAIRSDGQEECVCIRVAAKDQLYVTRDFIVTHNTLQTIAAIPLNTPVLITCTAGLKDNWVKEIGLWRPHLPTHVLSGRTSFRWPKPGENLVTNYDILPDVHDRNGIKGRACDGFLPPDPCPGCFKEPGFKGGRIQPVVVRGKHLPECTGFVAPKRCSGCHPILDSAPEGIILVADEAQNLKNPKSARAQRYTAMAEAILALKNGRSWAATGTPLENHPRELWNLLVALGLAKRAFPNGFDEFAKLFRAEPRFKGERFIGYDWPQLTAEDAEKIRPRLERVMLRRLRHEVLDLPDKIHQQTDVELDKKTFAACEALVRANGGLDQLIDVIEKGKDSTGIQGLSTLRQALAVAKIPLMLELVQSYEDQDEPVCVFSVHRAPIEKLKTRPGWGVIMGGEKNAAQIVEAFQSGRLKGVGYTLAGGVGITLTRAANLIRVDRDWRPTMDEQVEDRLMRIGQQRRVFIRDLVAKHPLEQRITELHMKKRGFIAHSVDAAAAKVVDSPQQSAFDQEIEQIRQEAFRGRVPRRVAKNTEERETIERLLRFVFEKRSAERIAGELAEEAQTIGLSEAQWALAARIASEGRPRESTQWSRDEAEATGDSPTGTDA